MRLRSVQKVVCLFG